MSLLSVSHCTLVPAFLSTWLQYISGSPAALHGQKHTLTSDAHMLRAKTLMFLPELLQLLLSDLAEQQTSLLLLLGQLTSFLEALLAPGCCTALLFLYLMTDGICIPQSSLPLLLLLLLMFDHSFLFNPVEQAEEPNWLWLMEKSSKKIIQPFEHHFRFLGLNLETNPGEDPKVIFQNVIYLSCLILNSKENESLSHLRILSNSAFSRPASIDRRCSLQRTCSKRAACSFASSSTFFAASSFSFLLHSLSTLSWCLRARCSSLDMRADMRWQQTLNFQLINLNCETTTPAVNCSFFTPALLCSPLLFPAEPSAWWSQALSPSSLAFALLHILPLVPAEVADI